jgi:hypothetical protein
LSSTVGGTCSGIHTYSEGFIHTDVNINSYAYSNVAADINSGAYIHADTYIYSSAG